MGREWVAKQRNGAVCISNCSQLGSDWDLCSESQTQFQSRREFRSHNDYLFTTFARGKKRFTRSNTLMQSNVTLSDVMRAARDHNERESDPNWTPAQGMFEMEICMHFSYGPVRHTRTTNSMIVHYHRDGFTIWTTATGTPCTSHYKPLWFETLNGEYVHELQTRNGASLATDIYDENTLWWWHDAFDRMVSLNYRTNVALFQLQRDSIERGLIDAAERSQTPAQRSELSSRAFKEVGTVIFIFVLTVEPELDFDRRMEKGSFSVAHRSVTRVSACTSELEQTR